MAVSHSSVSTSAIATDDVPHKIPIAIKIDFMMLPSVSGAAQTICSQIREPLASRNRRAHGDEFLGCGRVDCHGRVELLLGGAHLYGDAESLDDLRRVHPDHMGAQNNLALAVDHQLHQRALVAASHRVFHRLEIGLVDVELPALAPRFCLGLANGADGWVAEDGGRDAQHYNILTSTDAGQNFTLLTTFDNSPGQTTPTPLPVSQRTAFTENALPNLALNVTTVKVEFLSVENGYTGYTEIDVFGTQLFAPGDANRNGTVDINDFFVISNNFSKVPSSPGLDGDIVIDNVVNVLDFRLWKNSVSAEVAAQAGAFGVPEPSSLLLVGTASVAIAALRRRRS